MAQLTSEQKLLGELYAWIHNRAEWLRSQENKNSRTGGSTDQSTTPATAGQTTGEKADKGLYHETR